MKLNIFPAAAMAERDRQQDSETACETVRHRQRINLLNVSGGRRSAGVW